MKVISTQNAPAALGHYSQAIEHNNTVYVSGQLPLDPQTNAIVSGNVKDQTKQTLKNLEQILIEAGSSLDKLLKVTIYLSNLDNWGDINQAYGEVLGSTKPARSAVPTRELPKGCLLEIDAIAYI